MFMKNFSIIIVDDEETKRNILKDIIDWEGLGFNLCGLFEDGKDAIDFLRDNDIDIVLTDIRMFEVSGLDLAKYVYENMSMTKVIILSSYSDFEYAREAIQYNVYDYLLYPVKKNELETVFKNVYVDLEKRNQSIYGMHGNIVRDKTADKDSYLYSAVQMAKKYMQENLSQPLTLNDIASSVFLSKSYFAHEFKRITDETVFNYLLKIRMEFAITILKQKEDIIEKLYIKCGYTDNQYFNKVFKKYTGYTVKEFRRMA